MCVKLYWYAMEIFTKKNTYILVYTNICIIVSTVCHLTTHEHSNTCVCIYVHTYSMSVWQFCLRCRDSCQSTYTPCRTNADALGGYKRGRSKSYALYSYGCTYTCKNIHMCEYMHLNVCIVHYYAYKWWPHVKQIRSTGSFTYLHIYITFMWELTVHIFSKVGAKNVHKNEFFGRLQLRKSKILRKFHARSLEAQKLVTFKI